LGLGAGGAWTASTTIYDAQFKVLSAVNADLQRQLSELRESSQAKDAEMDRLREQISALSPQRREAEAEEQDRT
jgi:cell division protein FtsB